MRGTVQLIKIAGIPVRAHWTFGLLLVALEAFFVYKNGFDWAGIGVFGMFVLAMFTCVILHEFGHAFAAMRYGVQTRDIIILPIGGVARLDKLPEKPLQELVIAVAGPLVNVVIALLIGGILWWAYDGDINLLERIGSEDFETEDLLSSFFLMLGVANAYLVFFNMIPAFPLDGGRVLRSLLSIRMGRLKATRIAAFLGQGAAILFFLYGLFQAEPMLTLVAFFIFYAASSENQSVKMDERLSKFTVSDIYRTEYFSLYTHDAMSKAYERLKRGYESQFLVFDLSSDLVGILREESIIQAFREMQLDGPVSAYFQTQFETVSLTDTLLDVYKKRSKSHQSIFPVMDEGELIGVLDEDQLDNYLRVQQKILAG